MPEIIAFVSPKGGAGSTFVCSSMWKTLTKKEYKVLALDMCFENCTLDLALGFQNDYVYTLFDVLCNSCTLDDAVCGEPSGFVRLDYESCSYDFPKLFEVIAHSSYDYVLIDIDSQCKNILSGVFDFCSKVVIVTDCTQASVKLCENFIGEFEFLKEPLVIVNKIMPYLIRDGIHLTIDEVLERLSCELLGLIPWSIHSEFILGTDSDISDYVALFNPLFSIAERIEGGYVPACDIESLFKDERAFNYLMRGRK